MSPGPFILVVCLATALSCFSGRSAEQIGGPISGVLPGGVYHVTNNLTVATGESLTIMPGATLLFDRFVQLLVFGNLEAYATASSPVVFTSSSEGPIPGSWGGLIVSRWQTGSPSGRADLRYVRILFAQTGASVEGSAYLSLENSDVANSSGPGIQTAGRWRVNLRTNNISGNGTDGIFLETFLGSSTACSHTVSSAELLGNNVRSNANFGIRLLARGAPSTGCIGGGVGIAQLDASIEGNRVYDNGWDTAWWHLRGGIQCAASGGYQGTSWGALDTRLMNNLVHSNAGPGIWVNNLGSHNFSIANNTIVANVGYGILYDRSSSTGVIRNNIVQSNVFGIAASDSIHALMPSHNNVFGNATNWVNHSALGDFAFTNFNGTPADQAMNISTNSLFVGVDDFHLQTTSLCVNAGTTNGSPATDLDGRPRFSPPDIGCYEVQPTIRMLTPIMLPGSQVRLSMTVAVAHIFAVETSSNLFNWEWMGQATNQGGSAELIAPATNSRAFFRAKP